MGGEEALKNALEYYIACGAGTKYDPDTKVLAARECLEELKVIENITKEWIRSKYIVLSRAIKNRRAFLERNIKNPPLYFDVTAARAERDILIVAAAQFADFPELPL